LARITDQQAEVISTRRQDDLFPGKLVVDLLQEFGSATRPRIDALSSDKIGGGYTEQQIGRRIAHLLSVLRSTGRIEVDRPGRGGVWTLVRAGKDHGFDSAGS